MAHVEVGFQSEALAEALSEALRGKFARIEDALMRLGGMPTTPPKFKLAQAFGAEMGKASGQASELLNFLSQENSEPDHPRVYLPMAAAFGWAGRARAGRDVETAWQGLAFLAADERDPVRLATREALTALCTLPGASDELVSRAMAWLALPDREERCNASSTMVEVLGDKKVLSQLKDAEALFTYLSALLFELGEMPRSAERSDGRRRVLQGMPRTFAQAVATFAASGEGPEWLDKECEGTRQPILREVLSATLVKLITSGGGVSAEVIERSRAALKGSAKPPRDPTRIRKGAGRGARTRRIK